ncbi:MAG: hypothetical protein NFV71_00530, partial [Candidatus Accumulibacter sp.]|nr:hypothetical protein [Accumulibacter sp.]MDS4047984.1 hypothetical protein [Accumulibacter sp.]
GATFGLAAGGLLGGDTFGFDPGGFLGGETFGLAAGGLLGGESFGGDASRCFIGGWRGRLGDLAGCGSPPDGSLGVSTATEETQKEESGNPSNRDQHQNLVQGHLRSFRTESIVPMHRQLPVHPLAWHRPKLARA